VVKAVAESDALVFFKASRQFRKSQSQTVKRPLQENPPMIGLLLWKRI
jgi:hypothetical protein